MRSKIKLAIIFITFSFIVTGCNTQKISENATPALSNSANGATPINKIPEKKIASNLFDSKNYSNISELEGKILEIKKESLSVSEFSKLLTNPICFSTTSRMLGNGDLIARDTNKVFEYGLGGDIQSYKYIAPNNNISFYELPELFSKDIILTRIDKTKGIIIDRINNILAVIHYDYPANNFNLKSIKIIKVIKFNSNIDLKDYKVMDGFINNNVLSAVITSISTGEVYIFEPDSLNFINRIPSQGWYTLSLYTNSTDVKNLSYLIQVNNEKNRIRKLQLQNLSIAEEYEIPVTKIIGEIKLIKFVGANGMFILTESNEGNKIYSTNDFFKVIEVIDNFPNVDDGDIGFKNIQDFWPHSGNKNIFFVAVFRSNSKYPIRLIELYTSDWK